MIRVYVLFSRQSGERDQQLYEINTLDAAFGILEEGDIFLDPDIQFEEPVVIRLELGFGDFELTKCVKLPTYLKQVTLIISGKDHWSTTIHILPQSPSVIRSSHIFSSYSTIVKKERKTMSHKKTKFFIANSIIIIFANVQLEKKILKKHKSNGALNETIDFDLVPDEIFQTAKVDFYFENVHFGSSCDFFWAGSSPVHTITGKNCTWAEDKSLMKQGSGSLNFKAIHSSWENCSFNCKEFGVIGGDKYPTTCTLRSSWICTCPVKLETIAVVNGAGEQAVTLWSWGSELFKGIYCSGPRVIVAFDHGFRGDSIITRHTTLFNLKSTSLQPDSMPTKQK
jgi:hypothetical protein